jgi:hypothetical protein
MKTGKVKDPVVCDAPLGVIKENNQPNTKRS